MDDSDHKHLIQCFLDSKSIEEALENCKDTDKLEKMTLEATMVTSGLKLKLREAKEFVAEIEPVIDKMDRLLTRLQARVKRLEEGAKNALDTAVSRLPDWRSEGKEAA